MRTHRLLISIVLGLAAASLARAAVPVTATDLLRIRSVSSIDVSNDGSKAVLAVRSVGVLAGPAAAEKDAEPEWRNQSHLFLLDVFDPDAEPLQLTFGDRNDDAPALSPDGRSVAFARAGTEPEAKPQVWVISLAGGEARQVTHFEHGASNPKWSPGGRRLMFSAKVPLDEIEGVPSWPMERPRRTWKDAEATEDLQPSPAGTREAIRAWLARNEASHDPLVINRLSFQDELKLHDDVTFTHLFLIDPAGVDGDAEPVRLTQGFDDHLDASFMPDGDSVIYVAKKPRETHPDRVLETAIWQTRLDGSADRMLVAAAEWALSRPRPSRDGSVIAVLGRRMDEPAYRQMQLGLAAFNGDAAAEPVWLTDETTFDASVGSFEWMSSRAGLLFSAAWRGGFPLLSISPGLLEPAPFVTQDDEMPVGVHAFDVGAGAVVYAVTSAAGPCAVRVRDAGGDRLAWDLNEWARARELSVPREGWLTRPDGTMVQYWLMPPTHLEPDSKYPLVLEIHGGPAAMWGPGEFTMWLEFQLLCSWGYGVVYSNPRGSGGYGYAFQKANYQNWGEGPGGDVLAAVDQVVLEPWVDPDRLLVTGGSYAGYLTAWIVAQDHRFKAAVAQRGVYDLQTFYGEGNAWRLVEWAFGGRPWEARIRPILQRESPFTYVNRIRTPLLIMHGSRDLRTGVSQSEMMYRALKAQGREVEYVRYPVAGHDLSRTGQPRQRLDRLNRIIEFFERHIENPRPAPRDPDETRLETSGGPEQ